MSQKGGQERSPKVNSSSAATTTSSGSGNASKAATTSKDDLRSLTAERDKLNTHIAKLQVELTAAEQQKFAIEHRIQLLEFDGSVASDSGCVGILEAFTTARQQYEATLHTPTNYDKSDEVPFRCSDDFADTTVFDDWVDQALELHRARAAAGDSPGALRVLLRSSEMMQQIVDAVEKEEGADSGIVQECRERLLAAWEEVAADLKEKFAAADPAEKELHGWVKNISPTLFSVRHKLEQLGKPFSSVFD